MSLEEALEKRDELDEDFGSDLADASPQERKQALEADEKREQAKQAFLDPLEKIPSLMMTTAGSSFEGWRVTEYRGTLSTDAVVGAGLPAEADAIERAVNETLRSGFRCGDIMQENCKLVGCKAMGAEIRSRI